MKECVGIILMLMSFQFVFSQEKMEKIQLTPFERFVIEEKGTEAPYSGEYWNSFDEGSYTCKKCGALLYQSADKFESNCGWPSFDDEVNGAITHKLDADGRRTEIVCANCDAHLGHVFEGERLTNKNVRHCVNSVSLNFVPKAVEMETAIFASGCFWGTAYHFSKLKGVESTEAGYTGGALKNPTYRQVCSGETGHVEAVRVKYNPLVVSYTDLLQLYFETHDFTQVDGQGPDIGSQYLSRIFYTSPKQKQLAEKTIGYLTTIKNYSVATEVIQATVFYPAEDYHQDYYSKTGGRPYCHVWQKVFD